jgi:hypothetical protein
MKYKKCLFYYLNYPYYRCSNKKSPYFITNPYDIFRELNSLGIEGDDRKKEVRKRMKLCPCNGTWNGKGKNPCLHAKWKKEKCVVYKYNGYPMVRNETAFLHNNMINIMRMLAFLKAKIGEINWYSIFKSVEKDKTWKYEKYYPDYSDGLENEAYTQMNDEASFLTPRNVSFFSFLINEYGTYHVIMFIKHSISKELWKEIIKNTKNIQFGNLVSKFKTIHHCWKCEKIFTFEEEHFVECPYCGYGWI